MTIGVEGLPGTFASLEESIKLKDYDKVEELWMELALDGTDKLDIFIEFSDQIAKAGESSRSTLLLLMLVPDFISAGDYQKAYNVLRKAADHTPGDRDVRGQVLECVKHLHESNPMFTKAMELSKLNDSPDMRDALEAFETFIAIAEGAFVYHEAGWGVGLITEIESEEDTIYIDFASKRNHRMGLSAMGKMLKSLHPDHIRVLIAFDIDRLKEMAKADPPALIKQVLRDEGRSMNIRQIKALLVDSALTTAGWTKFWSNARAKLKRDPAISITSGNNPTLELQREVLTYEETMVRNYQSGRSIVDMISVIREYLDNKSDDQADRFFAPVLADLVTQFAGTTDTTDQFLILMTFNQCRKAFPQAGELNMISLEQFMQEVENIVELFESSPMEDYCRESLPIVQKTHPEDWPLIFQQVLLSGCTGLWESVYRELFKIDKDLIEVAFREVTRLRREKPENFAWFCRSGILGRISPDLLGHSRVELLEDLLILLDRLGSERGNISVGDARLLAGKVRNIILVELGERITKIFEEAGQNRTRHLLSLISHNAGLRDDQRYQLENKAYTVHPTLDVQVVKPYEDENTIYVTDDGLRKYERDLGRLVGEELPAVAVEIGKAKEFGDLSENAEYTAALEKQAQLAQRAEAMEADLKKAAVIEPDMVDETEVSIGTRVTLKTSDGHLETYTILGPWDADFDKKIISYRAALAQGLLGSQQGNSVTIELPDGTSTYEIMSIVSAV